MSAQPHDVELRAVAELAVDRVLNSGMRAIVLAVAIFAYGADRDSGLPLHVLSKVVNAQLTTTQQRLRALEEAGWVRYDRRQRQVTPGPRIQRMHEAVAR